MSKKVEINLEKQVIKFTKKPAKTGRNYAFYIPISYIKNGLVDPTKEYTVYLTESEKAANNK